MVIIPCLAWFISSETYITMIFLLMFVFGLLFAVLSDRR